MALDLGRTVQQIEDLAERLSDTRESRARQLELALSAMRDADAEELKEKAASSQGRPYLWADPVGDFASRYPPPEAPGDFCVASVDGSHIDVDRHMPVRCYLINLGGCLLTYGSSPGAHLYSHPTLFFNDDELYLSNPIPESREEVAVEGPILGLKRTVEEVRALASLIEDAPPNNPVLALMDGSLVLWGLAGRGYQPFVREEIIGRGLVPQMTRLRDAARSRTLAVAAYVSLPQTTEVVNALRLWLCPLDAAECRQRCSTHRSGQTPCDLVNGLLDRHLFMELLARGERSGLFQSNSSISRDFYGPHQVYFYYLNSGEEIARVELPEWVALDEGALALSHALVLDQCRRGMGYPAAIAEAHEQAVVTGQDRESFRLLVDQSLSLKRLPVYTSEKNRSKRTRWV